MLYRPTGIKTTSCFFSGFLPTAFLVAACLHTCFWRDSLWPWHGKQILNLCTAQLFRLNLTVTPSPRRLIQSQLCCSRPSFRPRRPSVPPSHFDPPEVACLHPASVALFMHLAQPSCNFTRTPWRILFMRQHMFS